MEKMRALLQNSLGRSLRALSQEDRLSMAWMILCGKALGARSSIVGYTDGAVKIEVLEGAWLEEVRSMREHLQRELPRIAGVPVTELHFIVKK
jgi:hypothetical protein